MSAQASPTSPRDLRQSVFGGYITDNWRVLENLTLNLGVRYEPVTVPTETANRLAILPTLTAAAPHLGSPYFNNGSYLNIAPRLGFAWDPYKRGLTSVRGEAVGDGDRLQKRVAELVRRRKCAHAATEIGELGGMPEEEVGEPR